MTQPLEQRYRPHTRIVAVCKRAWPVALFKDPMFSTVTMCATLYLTSQRLWAEIDTGRVLTESEPCPSQPSPSP